MTSSAGTGTSTTTSTGPAGMPGRGVGASARRRRAGEDLAFAVPSEHGGRLGACWWPGPEQARAGGVDREQRLGVGAEGEGEHHEDHGDRATTMPRIGTRIPKRRGRQGDVAHGPLPRAEGEEARRAVREAEDDEDRCPGCGTSTRRRTHRSAGLVLVVGDARPASAIASSHSRSSASSAPSGRSTSLKSSSSSLAPSIVEPGRLATGPVGVDAPGWRRRTPRARRGRPGACSPGGTCARSALAAGPSGARPSVRARRRCRERRPSGPTRRLRLGRAPARRRCRRRRRRPPG